MKRLSLHAPRWLACVLLLAFVTLAGSGSFLHTCHPQDDDQGTCDHQGMAPRSLDPALDLPAFTRALAGTHHGDCLACQWGTNTRQPATPSGAASVFVPVVPALAPMALSQYVSTPHTPSGIRGPTQV